MADDIVISARVDTTEALRDLAKLEQDRTVDVEIQPVNVDATIKAIDQRLNKLNTQLVIAVAEDNTRSVKSLQAKIDALTRRKTQLTIEVDADTRGATAAIDRAARDQAAEVRVTEDGAAAAKGAVDKAAQDQTATVKVKAESDGSLDALLGGLGNLPGVGAIDSALSAGGGAGLSGALGGGAGGMAALGSAAVVTAGAVAGVGAAFTLANSGLTEFAARTKDVERLGQVTGATTEEASRLISVMGRYGAEVGDIADVLLNIQGKAADGSLEELGVQLDPGAGAAGNLRIIADAYAALGSDADKAALASAALGEEGARQFVPLIAQGADEMERLLQSVDGAQVFSDDDIERSKELREATRQIDDAWTGLKLTIGADLADGVTSVLNLLKEMGPTLDIVSNAISAGIAPALQLAAPILERIQGARDDSLVDKIIGSGGGVAGVLLGDTGDSADATADALDAAALAAGGAGLAGGLEEAKTQAELLEEATANVKDQINSAIDPVANLAAGSVSTESAREGLDAQRDGLTDLNDAIDEAKGKQAELREQLAETDDVAAKAAESRAQVANDAAKAASDADEQRAKAAQDNAQRQVDAEESRAKAVEEAARRIAEVQAKEALDAAGAQARLAALTRQRNVLAADGDDPGKVRDLDNQIAVTKRDMAEAKTEAAASIAETTRKLAEQQASITASSAKGDAAYAEQVAKINQAEGEANAKSSAALAKINATEAEGLAKAAERRAKLEADLAELEAQAGIVIPAGVALSELPADVIAQIEAAFPELKLPTSFDAASAVADLAQAVSGDVANLVDVGLLPLDQALDETVRRLEILKAERIAIGIDPATEEAFNTIIGRLQDTQAEIDKLAGKAAAEAAARSGLGEKGAEAQGEAARAEAKISVTLDDDQAVAQLGRITGQQPDADVAVKTPGADAAEEKVDAVAKDRTATVTVEARGLRPILDALAQIQDKQITVTVNEVAGLTFDPTNPFASLPGNWAGGTMRAGGLARVAEHGPEVFEGRSGQRLVLRGDGAFMAPEAGRVVSGAETARRYPHLVGGAPSAAHRGDVNITVVSPHERLAGVDTHRTWTKIMGGKS